MIPRSSDGITPPNDTDTITASPRRPRKRLYRFFFHRGKTTMIPAYTYAVARMKAFAVHRDAKRTRAQKNWRVN